MRRKKRLDQNQMNIFQEILYNKINAVINMPIQSRYIAFKLSDEGNTDVLKITPKEDAYILECDKETYLIRPLDIDLPATPIEILIR